MPVSARDVTVLERHDGAPRLRRVLEEGSLGEPAAQLPRSEPERSRILGSGRSLGTLADFPPCRRRTTPSHTNFMVAGPWFHGGWRRRSETASVPCSFGGHKTALEFRQNIEAPFFRYYLHGEGDKPDWKVTTFQSGSNTWHTYAEWPPKHRSRRICICMPTELCRSHRLRRARRSIAQYVSDPANPVPYRARPISPTYPFAGMEVLGGGRSALRRSPAGCADVRQRAPRPRRGGHGRDRSHPVRLDFRHRLGLYRQADRCLSGEWAEERHRRARPTSRTPTP